MTIEFNQVRKLAELAVELRLTMLQVGDIKIVPGAQLSLDKPVDKNEKGKLTPRQRQNIVLFGKPDEPEVNE